jgi:hypothetical protein
LGSWERGLKTALRRKTTCGFLFSEKVPLNCSQVDEKVDQFVITLHLMNKHSPSKIRRDSPSKIRRDSVMTIIRFYTIDPE